MSKLKLSFACWDYDRIRPLTDGIVQPAGIDLVWLNLPVEEIFFRMMRYHEFDVAELSLSSYLIARDRGFPKFTAIPVFPSRSFRHSGIYVNAHAGIRTPSDLRGKRIGLPEYQLTACLWIRGILKDEYGVSPADVQWFMGGEEKPGRIEKVPLQLPPEIKLQPIGPDQTLNEMLEKGEIDALIAPRAPSSFMKGSPNVKRLFEHYPETEKEYFRKTGIFPIMHVVAIKDEILEAHPWVAMNLYQAFVKAKEIAYEELKHTAALKVTLPWLINEWEETVRLMGEDYWPYGLEKNRKTLETAIRYSHEQGMISRRLDVEEIFAKGVKEEYVI